MIEIIIILVAVFFFYFVPFLIHFLDIFIIMIVYLTNPSPPYQIKINVINCLHVQKKKNNESTAAVNISQCAWMKTFEYDSMETCILSEGSTVFILKSVSSILFASKFFSQTMPSQYFSIQLFRFFF